MEQSELISIIVPIYNGERYLDECLKSILRQTYSNLEIILINDGSIDKTLNICKFYQEIDSRIKVIDKVNEGVSSARNCGLHISKGKYISFIDCDDILENDAYEIAIKYMKEYDADIVNFRYVRFYNNNEIIYGIEKIKEYKYPEILEDYLSVNDYKKIGEANWNKLFKKDIIKNLEFEKIKIGEDFLFNYNAFKNSRIINIPDVLYKYRVNHESVTSAQFNLSKLLDYIYSRRKVYIDLKKNKMSDKYLKLAYIQLGDAYYYSLKKFTFERNLLKEDEFKDLIKKYIDFYEENEYKKWYKNSIKDRKIKRIIKYYKIMILVNNFKRYIKMKLNY